MRIKYLVLLNNYFVCLVSRFFCVHMILRHFYEYYNYHIKIIMNIIFHSYGANCNCILYSVFGQFRFLLNISRSGSKPNLVNASCIIVRISSEKSLRSRDMSQI